MRLKILTIFLTCATCIGAKVSYLPHYFTHITMEDSTIIVRDSTTTNDMLISPPDNRFTLIIAHDSLTPERIKNIKRLKATRTLSAIAMIAGTISTSLAPLSSNNQWMMNNWGLSATATGTYGYILSTTALNELEKLPISITIENNTEQEMLVNDMVRGLTWYIRANNAITLYVGNPEINALRVAYVGANPQPIYILAQTVNYLERAYIEYEDEDCWVQRKEYNTGTDWVYEYFLINKLTGNTKRISKTTLSNLKANKQ